MTTHVNWIAQYHYDHGTPPVVYAEEYVRDLIAAHLDVAAARVNNPAAFPGYIIEPTVAALGCRIVGELLDAGWTPPSSRSAPDLPEHAGDLQ